MNFGCSMQRYEEPGRNHYDTNLKGHGLRYATTGSVVGITLEIYAFRNENVK